MDTISDWILSCKKALRLFLRRIYVNKKVNREREQSRPLHEYEGKFERSERGFRPVFTINVILVCSAFICYFFLLPPTPTFYTFSEKTIEESVQFNPKMVQKMHIPKDARQKLAKDWIARLEKKMNITVTTEKLYERKVLLKDGMKAPTNVIIIDDNNTRVKLNLTNVKVNLEEAYPKVQNGGYFTPDHCHSEHKVAIIVPYRNRSRNLNIFLYNIHPFLMAQNLEYRIFVIEQFGTKKFNRGLLFNVGFKEMKKFDAWRCVVLHDVDLLPLDRRIFYTCPRFPRHMSSRVIDIGSKRNTSSPIAFGGVTAMSVEHYQRANGHSNLYWGWGGEDFDMFWRIRAAAIPIVRYNKTVARYYALAHEVAPENPLRYSLIRTAIDRWETDGLNNVEYQVVSSTSRHLFTHIIVNIHPWEDASKPSNNVFGRYNKLKRIMLKDK